MVSLPKRAVPGHGDYMPALPAMVSGRGYVPVRDERTVLMVGSADDSLRARMRPFEEEGFRVLTATSGWAALKSVREYMPGFVIIDSAMPDMDGFQFAGMIKNDSALREINVIFTAPMDNDERWRCAELGCGFIENSRRDEDMLSAVKRIMG